MTNSITMCHLTSFVVKANKFPVVFWKLLILSYFCFCVPSTCVGKRIRAPKIEVAFICIRNDKLVLDCKHKDGIQGEWSDLIHSVEKEHTYVFDETDEKGALVGVMCSAPYPVQWEQVQMAWLAEIAQEVWRYALASQYTSHQRASVDIEKPETFTYSTLLLFSKLLWKDANLAIGAHTCKGMTETGEPFQGPTVTLKVFQKIYPYDPLFPLSGKNVTIWLDEKRKDDGSVILPCHVSSPDVSVSLYRKVFNQISPSKAIYTPWKGTGAFFENGVWKELPWKADPANNTVEKWELVHPTKNLEFQPHLGFSYNEPTTTPNPPNLPSFHLTPGLYKCTAVPVRPNVTTTVDTNDSDSADRDEDEMFIHVEPGLPPVIPSTSIIQESASFKVSLPNLNQFQVSCCSKSSTPPFIYHLLCFSKEICSYGTSLLRSLNPNVHKSYMTQLSKVNGTCRHTQNFFADLRYPVIVRCVGEGIDYTGTVLIPQDAWNKKNQTTEPYLDWEDVDPYRMIAIRVNNGAQSLASENDTVYVYHKQNITFTCRYSSAYFALGVRATINFTNGTRYLIPLKQTSAESFLLIILGKLIIRYHVYMTPNMGSFSCHIPLPKSSKWIVKTTKLIVQEAKSVVINGAAEEDVVWTLNGTEAKLSCEFSATPLPQIIQWAKDNQVINAVDPKGRVVNQSNIFNITTPVGNISVLNVMKPTDYDLHGVYTCNISHYLGNVTKTFRVYVRASEEKWTLMSTLTGIAFVFIIFGILLTAAWRQRQALQKIKPENERSQNGFVRFR